MRSMSEALTSTRIRVLPSWSWSVLIRVRSSANALLLCSGDVASFLALFLWWATGMESRGGESMLYYSLDDLNANFQTTVTKLRYSDVYYLGIVMQSHPLGCS